MPAPRDTLYYDGACGLCRRSVRLLRALDWLGRLDAADATVLGDADLPVPRDRVMEGLPMRTRDGRVLVGFPAIRRALRQTPVGFLPALVMHAPGVSHAGRAVYARIAAGRARDAACPAPGAALSPGASSRRSR
ncbi:MAG: DUF393 domain-containing protein [Planctomycetota bacterium]|nr:MAG: DUF393 domain-containing protein [Planctomycetota bacterium]